MRFQPSTGFDASRRQLLLAGLGMTLPLSGCTALGQPGSGDVNAGDDLVRDALSKQTVYVHDDLPIDVPDWIPHTHDPNSADFVLASPSGFEPSELSDAVGTESWAILLAANETIDLCGVVKGFSRGGWSRTVTPSGRTRLSVVGFSPRTDGGVDTAFVVTPALASKYVLPAIASILEDIDSARRRPLFSDQRVSIPNTATGPRATLVSVVSEEKRLVTQLRPRVDFSNDLALVLEKQLRVRGLGPFSSLSSETDFDERTQVTSMWPHASSSENGVTASVRVEEHDRDVSHEFEVGALGTGTSSDVSISAGAFVTYEHRRGSIPISVANSLESGLIGEKYRCAWNLSLRGVRNYLDDA